MFVTGFGPIVKFTISNRGRRLLIIEGYEYVLHRQLPNSTNWRCIGTSKYSCRARAISRWINGVEIVRLSNGVHSKNCTSYPPHPVSERSI